MKFDKKEVKLMAQKDLKLLWGSNTKISGNNKPAIVDGKAYFAIVDGTTKYPDTAAPANEAFIYFDKDNTRYNVIAKRAIFDALGNKINSTYATDIESSGNTMSLFSADGGEAIDTATIINAAQIATSTRDDTEYDIQFSVNGYNSNAYSLLPAEQYKWGIVSCGAQTFGGAKTFSSETDSSSAATGAVVIKGGLGVAKKLFVGTAAIVGTSLSVGTSATIGTTLSVGSGASFGGTITVAGKNIYLGNITNKIVTIRSNDNGNLIQLGNSNANSLGFTLYSNGTDANYIELWRNTNASWRLVNDANFYIQSNYTTSAGDYYNVLSLEYNTGNATFKGQVTANNIVINNTSNDAAGLTFTKGSYNYITAPGADGRFVFIPNANGKDIAATSGSFIIAEDMIYAGATNTVSLGTDNRNWSAVHTRVIKSADTLHILAGSTLYVSAEAAKSIIFKQGD
jgi:hypothetical protein